MPISFRNHMCLSIQDVSGSLPASRNQGFDGSGRWKDRHDESIPHDEERIRQQFPWTGFFQREHQRFLHRRRGLRLMRRRMRKLRHPLGVPQGHGRRREGDHSPPDLGRRLPHKAADIHGLRPQQAVAIGRDGLRQGRTRCQNRIRHHRTGRRDGLRGLRQKRPMRCRGSKWPSSGSRTWGSPAFSPGSPAWA